MLFQFLRHPGAGGFVRSGTNGDQPGLARQAELGSALCCAVRRQPDRSLGLQFTVVIATVRPNIENQDRLAQLLKVSHFLDGHALAIASQRI